MHPAKYEGTTPEHLCERSPQIDEFFNIGKHPFY